MRVLSCPICGRSPVVRVFETCEDSYKMYCKGNRLFSSKMHILVMGSPIERCVDDWNTAVEDILSRAKNTHYSEEN